MQTGGRGFLGFREIATFDPNQSATQHVTTGMKELALSLLIAVCLHGCAGNGRQPASDERLEAAAAEASELGDFGKAIDLALPRAQAGDPEFEFSVGYLAVMWLEAPSPKEPPRYSLEEAVTWIRKAAARDSPQAAGFLRASYEKGRYGLPKDPALEACWRKVELAEQSAGVCIAEELE